MKANEIQIGDWLYSIIDRYEHIEKKLCKITGIRTDSDIPLIQCDDTDVWYSLESYEPVLLTAEILENNGFEKALQVSDTEPFDTDEEGNKHYSYNKTFWGWFQPDNIFCIPANGMGWLYIKYVHQLQHALKLCGIEKEIEL